MTRPAKIIHPEKYCHGKKVFRTRGQVRRAWHDGRARRTMAGDMGYYRCPDGRHWHLGHQLGSHEAGAA